MAMQPPPPPPPFPSPAPSPPYAPPLAPPYATPPASGHGYAGFWIRFVAYIIDSIIVGAVTFGLIKGTGVITVFCSAGVTNASDPSCGNAQIAPLFYVILLVPILYYLLLWAFGGTLGQRLLGMRVVSAATGRNLGLGRSLLRYVGLIIATIPIYLGLIWVGFDPRKQGWHDKIAGSFVVRGGARP
jgi:uncharacterized RDD family membrane protein YckC